MLGTPLCDALRLRLASFPGPFLEASQQNHFRGQRTKAPPQVVMAGSRSRRGTELES